MRLSVLDLFNSPTHSLSLAQIADAAGFCRYWVGEHHNEWQCGNPLLLSSLIALHTRSIRVGTGATSLLLRSPYLVAEDALLAREIVGERLDLGVAPAVASRVAAKEAITRGLGVNREEYPERVRELHSYLSGTCPSERRLRLPRGTTTPMWMLGNSRSTALLAASLGAGLCVSFHHGASLDEARSTIELYRGSFTPSGAFKNSVAIIAVSGVAGPPHVVDALRARIPGAGPEYIPRIVEYGGTYSEVVDQLRTLIAQTGADEAIIANLVFMQNIDRNSDMLEGLADAWRSS